MRAVLVLVALFSALFWPGRSLALDDFKTGFLTLGFSFPGEQLRLDVNVWYPSLRNPRELNYAPYTILAAREAKPVMAVFRCSSSLTPHRAPVFPTMIPVPGSPRRAMW